ncbi:hypothetical protein STRTUCAR8_08571 [Streptomyces turgidiscabies Car8]|uniref:Uncharacterized protein n=1 Tax=Streptomyces turgidiscabies (strain Car8) TaxID=698760 RepID=L7F944_STRT8|nr:hypothetical protein [Streptomyces turgidiscabies]ELP67624.1 hypothetical protein STRTUCAR8_08571 [Streptomyces turgidiscabies Car8]
MPDSPLNDYTWPACACGRQLRHDELARTACHLCQERADQALRTLPGPDGLYAALAGVLAPGSGGGAIRVASSRTAPLPLRLEPLSLTARGGIITVLQTWLVDWHEHLGWLHPRWEGGLQEQLDQAVKALRINLEWAATEHPAFVEFAREVSDLVRQCERQITGERAERPIAVACPCGTVLKVTVSTPGARCRGCSTQYGRTEVLDLPLATRTAA